MERFLSCPAVPREEGAPRFPGSFVTVHPDADTLALATAALMVREARRAVKARGRCTMALAGGSTPRNAYRLLTQSPFLDLMPWADMHVIWGDERCVDPGDPLSNEGMARDDFLDHVPIPPAQVHPMRCEGQATERGRAGDVSPEEAAWRSAEEYEGTLRTLFPRRDIGGATAPGHGLDLKGATCDLVLLGLGVDGHTASLFPGSELLGENDRWVGAVFAPGASEGEVRAEGLTAAGRDLWRLTLTVPFINRARSVVFVVSGRSKAPMVKQILEGPISAAPLPAQLIRPLSGVLRWYLDDDSASLLGMNQAGW